MTKRYRTIRELNKERDREARQEEQIRDMNFVVKALRSKVKGIFNKKFRTLEALVLRYPNEIDWPQGREELCLEITKQMHRLWLLRDALESKMKVVHVPDKLLEIEQKRASRDQPMPSLATTQSG
jgi:hypothetical protein